MAAVEDGRVDLVASLLTATCARWGQVDFSTTYYEAHQDVLVSRESKIATLTTVMQAAQNIGVTA